MKHAALLELKKEEKRCPGQDLCTRLLYQQVL